MRRLITALVACATLFGAAAPATAQTPPPTTTSDLRAEQWIRRLGEWTEPYATENRILQSHLLTLGEGVVMAIRYNSIADRSVGQAWAASWAPQMRADLLASRDRIAAAPPEPPTPDTRGLPASEVAKLNLLLASARDSARSAREIADTAVTDGETVITAIEQLFNGDRSATARVSASYYELNAALQDIQGRQFKASIASGGYAGSPQESISGVYSEVTIVAGAAYRCLALLVEHRRCDPAAPAAMRAAADRIDRNAREVRPRVEAAVADMRVSLNGAMLVRGEAAYETYNHSAILATNAAAIARRMAKSVEARDIGSLETGVNELAGLLQQMAALDLERRDTIVGP